MIGRSLLFSEFYQPLDFHGDWFCRPALTFGDERIQFFEEGESVAELNVGGLTAGLDLGRQFNRMEEMRLGIDVGREDVTVETGTLPPEFPEEVDLSNIRTGGIRLLSRWDNLDNINVPRDGIFGDTAGLSIAGGSRSASTTT